MTAHMVYIGLGSNLNDPLTQLKDAISYLSAHPSIESFECSRLYSSKPVGPQDQPDYINAVARFSSTLPPIELLDLLQSVEQNHHRVRERHWGPRTLDLDILLIDRETISHPRLNVPHPFMLERGFVIQPLSDLAPELLLSNGKSVEEHVKQLDTSDLVSIEKE
ncbi:2-amino-4-hydroxy-6-hydroxymethyldihydropteridine diphosphokinase [Marinomonas mediterranea]|uniref:2-amino-4-hydroxy-6- hydroxymethyldihydropteridine diphosphokinase n=2 Tax=Marinomonas mediterranea TaxID=119864 RepID=UPI00234B8F31|nr:2-amino-4-hydroxy-6-hydroxymethyldihydropteridine diphosphokinase [Marinomonas mediterranea]WCN10754.1 2-amino-4-hydroxy-6-hydroxymethyldihydropteridine diphosphokinase [Marinomonas mediterranea]WCN14811.1 2-amino-4-hydroxy-6-hydroxymethyldihydropteridine diphosphokinase [Marinomonas mediterranea]